MKFSVRQKTRHSLISKGLHFSSSATGITHLVFQAQTSSIQQLLLSLVVVLWYQHHQNVRFATRASIFTNGPFWTLFRESHIATWRQASTSPHDLFSPGASTSAETAYSTMPSPNLSWCQTSAALHDYNMSSKPVPSGRFLPVIKFGFWHGMQPLHLQTASVH